MDSEEIAALCVSYAAITTIVHMFAGIEANRVKRDLYGNSRGYVYNAQGRRRMALMAWCAPLWPLMLVAYLALHVYEWFSGLRWAGRR